MFFFIYFSFHFSNGNRAKNLETVLVFHETPLEPLSIVSQIVFPISPCIPLTRPGRILSLKGSVPTTQSVRLEIDRDETIPVVRSSPIQTPKLNPIRMVLLVS